MTTQKAKSIIKQAVDLQAQDIYMIPSKDGYELYMRIREERRFIDVFELDCMASLIGHFKFVAGMMVGEKRRSQLGACDYEYSENEVVSLRLSTVGDYRGKESMVIRLLHSKDRDLHYWHQGFDNILEKMDHRGLYLFSGPVGSGKTTLMHELVKKRFPIAQVISIEDPVEIKQEGMLQLQLNEAIGMTYDSLIKLTLRHRPDVLIIGEIRDKETARAVIRASLTGVTVLSTIHAKSIPGVYERLLELGVERSELDNGLRGIAYQRLIGGGGLIDFATKNFEKHSSDSWNQQLDDLVKKGYLTAEQIRGEKIEAGSAGQDY
ncbi:competence type IV pilus ATPase ComGA [Streptococcus dentiloxodontae]